VVASTLGLRAHASGEKRERDGVISGGVLSGWLPKVGAQLMAGNARNGFDLRNQFCWHAIPLSNRAAGDSQAGGHFGHQTAMSAKGK